MKDAIYIESAENIRRRQVRESLEAERTFWMRTAEELLDTLNRIFDDAESEGRLRLSQRGKAISLIVEPTEEKKP